ncbi:MAG TPA: LLM class flavin-dependent oxidoreductase [Candidatus Binataceae bacterium]|jgi:alkanesulfonate monooxygenase SsuD/methylene tetrahydromethanopterin reductase-like flavin-dependent oxidoreductase (luciferase family)|nr:LLM class flavin-dependent oxidoreductase [Candidatus Binataceae bacterium]
MRFGLTTDFRNPANSGKTSATVYAETIELFTWAESLGFGAAYIFEHHFTDDDYMPSPMVAATAIAARTKKMRIGPDIAILPLYDPVRLAEDGAVLDVISDGRLDFGVGLGYRPQEYAGYGLDITRKGSRANEALQIIRALWQGETVTFHGKHFRLDGARLSPRPVQRPNPPIWVGGFSRAAARRAARYGDGYVGPSNKTIYEMYLAELRAAGKDPAHARVMGGDMWLIVADDPDRTFATYAPHLLYWFNAYSKWFEGTDTSPWPHLENAEELLSRGLVNVVTAEAAVKLIKSRIAEVPVEMYTFMLTPPAIALDAVRTSLELFANKVMPHFK